MTVSFRVGQHGDHGVLRTGLLSLAHEHRGASPTFPLPGGEFDLAVDLGHQIGSLRWWRGLITISALISTATSLALGSPPQAFPSPPPQERSPEQIRALEPAVIRPLKEGARTGEQVPMTAQATPLAATPEPDRISKEIRYNRGDTLVGVLRRAGVSYREANAIVQSLGEHGRIADPPSGEQLRVTLGRRISSKEPRPVETLAFRPSFDMRVQMARLGSTYLVNTSPIRVINAPAFVDGEVGRGIFVSARELGAPAGIVSQYIKALSYSVDFERDVGSKDRFSLVFEREVAETGEVKTGRLLYAKLDRDGKRPDVELVWFAPRGEKAQFFNANGSSIKRLLMKTPVDGARMTSGFGLRLHPILGYSRLHKGVDFAAGTGTPVMAAGAGTVVVAGYNRGHGNYVKIRHGGGYETSYSHLSRFAKGLRVGARVAQGQVVAYVGSTGLSTGPHLHYEVHYNGKAINPAGAKLPTGFTLAGTELAAFKSHYTRLKNLPRNQRPEAVLAQAGVDTPGGEKKPSRAKS